MGDFVRKSVWESHHGPLKILEGPTKASRECRGEVLHPELSLSGFIQPPNPPIGAVVTVVLPLLIYFLVVITCNERTLSQAFEDFVIFVTICLLVGLMAFCYLHYMWVKPSRQLLLRLQQYSREGVKVCRLGGYLP